MNDTEAIIDIIRGVVNDVSDRLKSHDRDVKELMDRIERLERYLKLDSAVPK